MLNNNNSINNKLSNENTSINNNLSTFNNSNNIVNSLSILDNKSKININDKFYDKVYSNYTKRNRLTKPRLEVKFNVWSVLRDALGKDLNKFCVPGKKITNIYLKNIYTKYFYI